MYVAYMFIFIYMHMSALPVDAEGTNEKLAVAMKTANRIMRMGFSERRRII